MRKITKIKRSIRAISPVISVLLMIAIAVVASLVAYAWVMGYLGFQTDKSGDQIEIQSYTVDQNLTLYVQNTGQNLVNLKQDSSVYVNDVLYNIIEADDLPVLGSALIPISVGQTVKVEVDYYTYQQGDRIKVVTYEGTYMEITGTLPSSTSNTILYTITPSAGTGGSINPNTVQQIAPGGTKTFAITANNGYHIDSVHVDGSPVSLDAQNRYTFSNVQASHTIRALFGADGVNPQNRYTITVIQADNGVINPGTSTYDAGVAPSFTITPNNGYHIASITANGASIPVTNAAGQTYTFAALSSAGTLTATFEVNPVQYQITVAQAFNGVIAPGTSSYPSGSTPSFTITPNNGYHIASITANGASVAVTNSAGQTYTFAALTADGSLTATFAINPINQYTITPSAGSGGSISPSTPQTVTAGGSITFNIAASTNYHVRDVLVDGVSQGARTSYQFTNVQASHTIHVTFEADGASTQYTITPSAGSGGSITPNTPQTVTAGGSVTFNIAASQGYHIVDVLVDGTTQGAIATYQFTNVQASHTIHVTFEADGASTQYTITPSAGPGGSISPSAPQTVNSGGSVTFTVAANSDYHIASVTVDGSAVTLDAQNRYTFNNVQANHVISAAFEANVQQYTVTFVMGTGGQSINPSIGDHSYAPGTIVQLGATADSTHVFQSWTTSNPTGITFDNPNIQNAKATINGAGTITANFVPSASSNKLAFVAGAPQNLQINTASDKIVIQRQDSTGTPITVGSTIVNLGKTAGTFYSDAACTIPITTSVTINAPSSTYDFYYKCPTVGTQTLTAQATDYQTATTTFIISTQAPTTYTVTYTTNNDAYGTITPSGTISNYAYGAQVTITATPKAGYVFDSWTHSGNINVASTTTSSTTATILGDGIITANFRAQSTDKLVFTRGTNQYIEFNQASSRITVSRQTSSGVAITSGTTVINLASTSSTGRFYSTSSSSTPITQVTITSGNTADFYYRDSSAGTPTITASATNFASAQTTFTVNTRCTGYEGTNWLYGWTVGSQPPWYRGVGVGVDNTDCAMSDSTDYLGGNDGAFTCNSLDTRNVNTITITFQYKLVNTDSDTDFVIAYTTDSNPDLMESYFNHHDFNYFTTLGTTQNDGQWHTYTTTFTRTSNPSVFDTMTNMFWFRFESNLNQHQGAGLHEYVYVDNVVISLT